ncbi:UvrD-helicase domain-containing protein [Thermoanaerobacterium sp. RBIITD]|uniref:HelD family protein n=1 Tax=Thermoanaerobacterium sp. RBIITD TaxID=1550240 RepID=UPI000BBF6018|nr:UvrD-helicase domain-containing protein [Thermoanaerobacterium sp. RBIITD]SNX54508.1 DNA helicase-2 / ATP-dependent DNA helicase PcrA [Thermoanaerobacterium sp. RBIITD]
MVRSEDDYHDELAYLKKTIDLIDNELYKLKQLLVLRKENLIESTREMWENSSHFTNDFDKLIEANQYLMEVKRQSIYYNKTLQEIKIYKRMLYSPYFGRFDFIEDGYDKEEKIYIGLHNLRDPETFNIIVYDWRAPISSVFYQFEKGRAYFKAPSGIIKGNITLKRQYMIKDSKLEYFFDCNIKIDDEILQEVLSRNASTKMRTIVETIQREQDMIIRDTENELLLVQGVAGSGKTSIALHRIAYLLYFGKDKNINKRNILLISSNRIFSEYIKDVLPELGEENVNQIVFEDFLYDILKGKGVVEKRGTYIENLIISKNNDKIKENSIKFKGSREFAILLDRFISYYERKLIQFTDIYYDGRVIFTRQDLKNIFLNNKIKRPAQKRLERLKKIIFERIHSMKHRRISKLEKFVEKSDEHKFEVKAYSRLLSIKETKVLMSQINKFTNIDYLKVYKLLFSNKNLFKKLSYGIKLTDDIDEIIQMTIENLEKGFISYEDCGPLLYMKFKLEGCQMYEDIRHVVIDEAQDYSPLFYEVFNMLFSNANYTILGDIYQTFDRELDNTFYDEIEKIFNKSKATKVFLKRSYRSSFEINAFNQNLLQEAPGIVPFDRHEDLPTIIYKDNNDEIYLKMILDIKALLKAGYKTIAIICKTKEESKEVYEKLKKDIRLRIVDSGDNEILEGVNVITPYAAKGLEFDAVLVFNVSKENYKTVYDRRLLYVACTRALHRLMLYYTGEITDFLKKNVNYTKEIIQGRM